MLVITSEIKKLAIGSLLVVFIILTVNTMMSGFSKTIVVTNKVEKYKTQRGRLTRSPELYYVLTDENGITYDIDERDGRNIKIGAILNVKGYKSLFLRDHVISDILSSQN